MIRTKVSSIFKHTSDILTTVLFLCLFVYVFMALASLPLAMKYVLTGALAFAFLATVGALLYKKLKINLIAQLIILALASPLLYLSFTVPVEYTNLGGIKYYVYYGLQAIGFKIVSVPIGLLVYSVLVTIFGVTLIEGVFKISFRKLFKKTKLQEDESSPVGYFAVVDDEGKLRTTPVEMKDGKIIFPSKEVGQVIDHPEEMVKVTPEIPINIPGPTEQPEIKDTVEGGQEQEEEEIPQKTSQKMESGQPIAKVETKVVSKTGAKRGPKPGIKKATSK